MFNGCFFLWANISVYVLSYLYIYDPSVNQDAIFYVDTALILLNTTGYQIGTHLLNVRKLNPKLILLLGGSISLCGIFASSYTHSLGSFICLYGVFSGIGCGIMYLVPLVCGWEYFPERRGLVTGIIVGSYGLGSFIFTQVATKIVNPFQELPTIEINKDLKYYDSDVAIRVPMMFRIMVCIWSFQVLLAVLFISKPSSSPV